MAPNAVYVGYMLAALALLLVVYTQSFFDLRGVGRVRRRPPPAAPDEAEYEEDELERGGRGGRRDHLVVAPRADLTMVIAVFGALGVALGAALGFLGPRLIDMIYADPDPAASATVFRWTADAPLERVSQVIGALSLGLVALRMIRVFMALAAFAVIGWLAHATVAYTLGRSIWAPLGL